MTLREAAMDLKLANKVISLLLHQDDTSLPIEWAQA